MEKSKLKELVKEVIFEYLNEMSTSAGVGGYLTKYAFKPKKVDESVAYSTKDAFESPSKKESDTPTGFEKMPKSGKNPENQLAMQHLIVCLNLLIVKIEGQFVKQLTFTKNAA